MSASVPQPVVLVLASGRGDRFRASGGQGNKLQVPLAGQPVLDHALAAVRESGLPFHVEDRGHPGMGDSIAAAVKATRDAPGWLVLPGDLPLVRAQTLRAVAAALQDGDAEVVVPTHGGQRGHPVGFAAVCGAGLAALSGPQGAVTIVQRHRVRELAVQDEGILMDVDTMDELAQVQARLAQRRPA